MDKIKILVVDDIEDTRKHIVKLLSLEDDFHIIGEATNGIEAVEKSQSLEPDIVLMDINMPEMDGISATEIISIKCPYSSIIIMSVQEEQEYLRKAMMAGARDFLVKPFNPEELVSTIRKIYQKSKERMGSFQVPQEQRKQPGKVISFFAMKGGVGKTTIALNSAIALAHLSEKKVVLMDLDLQFGDIGLMMGIKSPNTIAELCQDPSPFNADKIEPYLVNHPEGKIDVLLSCSTPEMAEIVGGEQVREIIENLSYMYDYVIIDTAAIIRDIELMVLDLSHIIFLVGTLEITAIKDLKLSLKVFNNLEYDAEKIRLILNRAIPPLGIEPEMVEKTLEKKADILLPSDGQLAVRALNAGKPFYLYELNSDLIKGMDNIARLIEPDISTQTDEEKSILSKLSSLFGK
jgi:pilus assembly protein CpaE